MTDSSGPNLIAVAGPKGGVGKSFLALNLAVALADEGVDAILADLDLGGANLQALLGISGNAPNMADFVNRKTPLAELIQATEMPNLRFLPGSTDVVGLANLVQWQKVKLINQLGKLESKVVVIDLGSGSTFNILDIYAACHIRLLVTTPEMTSVLNAYGFIKSLVYRLFLRRLKSLKMMRAWDLVNAAVQAEAGEASTSVDRLIDTVAVDDSDAAEEMRAVVSGIRPQLILNMIQKSLDFKTALALQKLVEKRLGIRLTVLGQVPFHADVRRSVIEMRPMLLENRPSEANSAVRNLAAKIRTSLPA